VGCVGGCGGGRVGRGVVGGGIVGGGRGGGGRGWKVGKERSEELAEELKDEGDAV